MSFLDDLADDEPAEPAELVPAPPATLRRQSSEEKQLARLREREDRILERTLTIIEDAAAAADVDTGSAEVPQAWIKELGSMDGPDVERRARVAQDARKNPKEHPVYLDIATKVAVGIIKARAAQPAADISLNFSLTIAAPPSARPIIDIDPEDEK